MPRRSRTSSSRRFGASQIANANMPRKRCDAVVAPLLVGVDDRLGVGPACGSVAVRLELAPELGVVVDLAVERRPRRCRLRSTSGCCPVLRSTMLRRRWARAARRRRIRPASSGPRWAMMSRIAMRAPAHRGEPVTRHRAGDAAHAPPSEQASATNVQKKRRNLLSAGKSCRAEWKRRCTRGYGESAASGRAASGVVDVR